MTSTARTPIRVTPLPRPGRRVVERRRQRSSSIGEALELALSAAANESGLDVILVADDYGMLVASSHTALELDMLAAITPIVSRGRAKASIKRNGDHRDLTVKSIKVLDETLHVAALGGEPSGRAMGLMRSVTVARRLLS